ncbi:peptidase M20 [Nocardioides flavus (ex Wang et al. 2016)]|uniref:Peptidase M20 n=1 Tax=Nocardioides flavus (ex Wang et al. 2016) TaxID=2058780 RepID=A0ABQ3HG24_9ACTN|nr:peptidase M20 [Nocardioides flavus (ex Wang et al. 2016)]
MVVSPELELARQLIRLQSTPESRNQLQVAELLADRLDAAGFDTTLLTYGDHHGNVVARWGRPDIPAVCLSGHLDTVTVVEDDWSQDPFGADVVGTRLYGRGAADMKSGVAAIVRAAEMYVAASRPDGPPIVLVLTAEEEVGSLGAAVAAAEPGLLPDSRVLLISEPTSNQPVLGHRGAVWLDLVARGRSCHASTPELGDNAIEKLMDGLRVLSEWCAANPTEHKILGPRTLNIGRLDGGVLRNIVPDHAMAQLDFRTPSQEEQATLSDALAELLKDRVTVEPVLSLPPVYTEPTDPVVHLFREAARDHVDLTDEPAVARFFTDASVLTARLGMVPTVICGPGSPDQAHVVDEWCDTAEIEAATAIYLNMLHKLAASPG